MGPRRALLLLLLAALGRAGPGLRLCRRLLGESRALRRAYAAERLPGVRLHLAPPPGHPLLVSIAARDWLALSPPQRLQALGRRLPLLRGALGGAGGGRRERALSWGLRDLGRLLGAQLGVPPPPPPRPPPPPQDPPSSFWGSQRRALGVLRATELFLLRALRDLALLGGPQNHPKTPQNHPRPPPTPNSPP